ncbi:unnamed protein product [Trichogramma brassicae]|uniref:C2H2-type domain-containing protein n=1 Tax=Trichogramma brassicae TaxID=86971 RepID=A0A6H5IFK5_9HYME|nr:unnamed protein product [Trichogramma brassicae]
MGNTSRSSSRWCAPRRARRANLSSCNIYHRAFVQITPGNEPCTARRAHTYRSRSVYWRGDLAMISVIIISYTREREKCCSRARGYLYYTTLFLRGASYISHAAMDHLRATRNAVSASILYASTSARTYRIRKKGSWNPEVPDRVRAVDNILARANRQLKVVLAQSMRSIKILDLLTGANEYTLKRNSELNRDAHLHFKTYRPIAIKQKVFEQKVSIIRSMRARIFEKNLHRQAATHDANFDATILTEQIRRRTKKDVRSGSSRVSNGSIRVRRLASSSKPRRVISTPTLTRSTSASSSTPPIPASSSRKSRAVHESRKDYACDKFQKEFTQKANFLTHLKTVHDSRKDFACDQGEKKWTQKHNLLIHLKTIHDGRKDYACNQCDSKFGLKSSLLKHQKTVHEDRKDYACDKCEKKFGHKSVWLEHQKAVHQHRKNYACNHCEKIFGQKRSLILHLRAHEDPKDYGSSNCEQKFRDSKNLINHQKSVHEERINFPLENQEAVSRLLLTFDPGSHTKQRETEDMPKPTCCGVLVWRCCTPIAIDNSTLARYQFFLQVKQDILQGRLPVSFDLAAELGAYVVQSELGDYDPRRHSYGYVSEFRFLANQTSELEARIVELHKTLVGLIELCSVPSAHLSSRIAHMIGALRLYVGYNVTRIVARIQKISTFGCAHVISRARGCRMSRASACSSSHPTHALQTNLWLPYNRQVLHAESEREELGRPDARLRDAVARCLPSPLPLLHRPPGVLPADGHGAAAAQPVLALPLLQPADDQRLRLGHQRQAATDEAHGAAELHPHAEPSCPAPSRRGPGDGRRLRRGQSSGRPDGPEPELPGARRRWGQRRVAQQSESQPEKHEERALDPEPAQGSVHVVQSEIREVVRSSFDAAEPAESSEQLRGEPELGGQSQSRWRPRSSPQPQPRPSQAQSTVRLRVAAVARLHAKVRPQKASQEAQKLPTFQISTTEPRRRHRSKHRSPSSKHPLPDELRKHLEFGLVDTSGMSEQQRREIAYTVVQSQMAHHRQQQQMHHQQQHHQTPPPPAPSQQQNHHHHNQQQQQQQQQHNGQPDQQNQQKQHQQMLHHQQQHNNHHYQPMPMYHHSQQSQQQQQQHNHHQHHQHQHHGLPIMHCHSMSGLAASNSRLDHDDLGPNGSPATRGVGFSVKRDRRTAYQCHAVGPGGGGGRSGGGDSHSVVGVPLAVADLMMMPQQQSISSSSRRSGGGSSSRSTCGRLEHQSLYATRKMSSSSSSLRTSSVAGCRRPICSPLDSGLGESTTQDFSSCCSSSADSTKQTRPVRLPRSIPSLV